MHTQACMVSHTSIHAYALTQMQEPFYHVLENTRALYKDIPYNADTCELSSPAHDPPPVYQDITELPSKPSEDIDHKDKHGRSNNQDESLLAAQPLNKL